MRRVTLFLARHGETDWNAERRWQGHTDTFLNERGRAQARELAERARALGITALGSSDLERARRTAHIVAEALGGLPVLAPDERLRERGFGGFEGLTAAECEARFPDAWARYREDARSCPPDAEPHDAFRTRVVSAIVRAADHAAEHTLLLVAHGGVLRAIADDPKCAIPNACVFRVVVERSASAEVARVVGAAAV